MELGPLEMRVLGLLDAKRGASVADVQAQLAARGHEAAYTTVLTVLGRLHDKGVARREREGRRHLYFTATNTRSVKTSIVQRVQRALFDNDRLRPIVALLDAERLDEAELRQLRELIDKRLEDEEPPPDKPSAARTKRRRSKGTN